MGEWTFTAAGRCADGEEPQLAKRLATVLDTVKFGCTASQLTAEGHNGPVHDVGAAAERLEQASPEPPSPDPLSAPAAEGGSAVPDEAARAE